MAKRWNSAKAAAKKVKAAGRTGPDGVKDTEIVHLNKSEMPIVDRALKRYGGSGKTNPKTGAKEYTARDPSGAGPGGVQGGGVHEHYSSTGSGGSKSNNQSIPTKSTGPTPANDTLGSPESAAASNASLGTAEALGSTASPAAPAARPANVTPMDKPAPRGADQYREGADLLGIGGSIAGGIAGNVGRALSEAVGLGDPLADHMGKQTGWSAERSHGVSGDIGGSGGAQGTSKPADTSNGRTAKASDAAASPSATPGAAAAGASGGTVTVNADGTIRTQDTSVAGLRAQRRYGAKTKPAAAA